MWRLLVFVIFWAVVCAIVSVIPRNSVSATGSPLWATTPIMKIAEANAPTLSADAKVCVGRMDSISVGKIAGHKEACIFGSSDGIRVARYHGLSDKFVYAVAFPMDAVYLPVRGLCEAMVSCAYGQADDAFLLQELVEGTSYRHGVIKGFSKYLKRVSTYYEFEYHQTPVYLGVDGSALATGKIGMSTNGRWALVEFVNHGVVKLNLNNLHYRRIVVYDAPALPGMRPPELTISNDGLWVAAVGFGIATMVLGMADGCGDSYINWLTSQLPEGTKQCELILIRTDYLSTEPHRIYAPKFSDDAKKLVLNVETQTKTRTVTYAPTIEGTTDPHYLAFGDSFSSGEGELKDDNYINSTNTAENKCHVSDRSYPYLIGNFWEIVTTNLACSGSRIAGVKTAVERFFGVDKLRWPTAISLSVGGNDVDFMGKLKSCIGTGTCEWAKTKNRSSTALEIKALFPKVIDILTELKTNFSPAGLFVVGYPVVINSAPNAQCSFAVGSLLDPQERLYMAESIKYLNKVLRAAATYMKIPFYNIEDAFQGERLCDQYESAMNAIRYGDDVAPIPTLPDFKLIGAESFHPTPRGHQLVAQKINAQIGTFWASPVCSSCQFDDTQLEAPSYWSEGTVTQGQAQRQIAGTFLNSDTITDASSVIVNFAPNTFEPNSKVTLELHSEVQYIDEFTTNNDGSLAGSLKVLARNEGYHTIHAYGESRSGEKIDIYQIVYVPESEVFVGTTNQQLDKSYSQIAGMGTEPTGTQGVQLVTSTILNDHLVTAGTVKDTGYATQIKHGKEARGQPISWWYLAWLAGVILLTPVTVVLFLKRKPKKLPSDKNR